MACLDQNWTTFKDTVDQTLQRFMEGYSAAECQDKNAMTLTARTAAHSTLVTRVQEGTIALDYAQLKEQAQTAAALLLNGSFEQLDQYIARVDPKGSDGKPLPCAPDRMAKLVESYRKDHARACTPEGKTLAEMTLILERNLAVLLSPGELALLNEAGINPSADSCPMLQILRYAAANPDSINLPQLLVRYVGFIPTVLSRQRYDKNRMIETIQCSGADIMYLGPDLQQRYPWAKEIIAQFKQRVSGCRSLEELQIYLSSFAVELLNPNLIPQVKRQLENRMQQLQDRRSNTGPAIQNQIVASFPLSTAQADLTVFGQPEAYNNVLGAILQSTVASRLLRMQVLRLYLERPDSFLQNTLPAANQSLLQDKPLRG